MASLMSATPSSLKPAPRNAFATVSSPARHFLPISSFTDVIYLCLMLAQGIRQLFTAVSDSMGAFVISLMCLIYVNGKGWDFELGKCPTGLCIMQVDFQVAPWP